MNREEKYHSADHCKYLTQYHIIWCPKFRYDVLDAHRQGRLKSILTDICRQYRYQVKAMEVMPDHIHLFVDCPQTAAPCDIARTLKSLSAVRLLKEDEELRKFYRKCGVLWRRGYFISTIGCISEATVRKYIEDQKEHS